MMEDLTDVVPPPFINAPRPIQELAGGGEGGDGGRRRSLRIAVARGRQRKIYSDSEEEEDDDKHKDKRKSGAVAVKPKAVDNPSRKRKLDNWEIGSGAAPSAPVPVVYPLLPLGRKLKMEGPQWLHKEEEDVGGPEEPEGGGIDGQEGGGSQGQDKPVKVEVVDVEEEEGPMCQIRIVDIRSLVEPEEQEVEEHMSPVGPSLPQPRPPPPPMTFTLPAPPPMYTLPPPLKFYFDEEELDLNDSNSSEDPLESPSSSSIVDEFRGREGRTRWNLISTKESTTTTGTLAPPLQPPKPPPVKKEKGSRNRQKPKMKKRIWESHAPVPNLATPGTASAIDDYEERLRKRQQRWGSPSDSGQPTTTTTATLEHGPLFRPDNLRFKKIQRLPPPAPLPSSSPLTPLLPPSRLAVADHAQKVIVGTSGNAHNVLGCREIVPEEKLRGYSEALTGRTSTIYQLRKIVYVRNLSMNCDGRCLYYLFNTGNNIRNIQFGRIDEGCPGCPFPTGHAVVTFAKPCDANTALLKGPNLCHQHRFLLVAQYRPQPEQIKGGTTATVPMLPTSAPPQQLVGGSNTTSAYPKVPSRPQPRQAGTGANATPIAEIRLPLSRPQPQQLTRTVKNDQCHQSNSNGSYPGRSGSPPSKSWSSSKVSPPSQSWSSSKDFPPSPPSESWSSPTVSATTSHPPHGGVTLDPQWHERYIKRGFYTSFE